MDGGDQLSGAKLLKLIMHHVSQEQVIRFQNSRIVTLQKLVDIIGCLIAGVFSNETIKT